MKQTKKDVKEPNQSVGVGNAEKCTNFQKCISYSNAEYEMLRAEILQYMEEYQNLRNMMYVGTAALLGLNSTAWKNVYLFLLPLIIILPSYIIYFDYWKSVSVAAAYIRIFLEKGIDGKYVGNRRWESMHNSFSEEVKKDENGYFCRKWDPRWSGMMCHKIPYIKSDILCMGIYFVLIIKGPTENMPFCPCVAWTLGVVVGLVSLGVFLIFRYPDEEVIDATWKRLKTKSENK